MTTTAALIIDADDDDDYIFAFLFSYSQKIKEIHIIRSSIYFLHRFLIDRKEKEIRFKLFETRIKK